MYTYMFSQKNVVCVYFNVELFVRKCVSLVTVVYLLCNINITLMTIYYEYNKKFFLNPSNII
jgi:hypothetical protein